MSKSNPKRPVDTGTLSSLKATLLFEWEQFVRKHHLKETEEKIIAFLEQTRKEIAKAVEARDLQLLFKLLERERQTLEKMVQKSLAQEVKVIQNFLLSKKDLFEQLKTQIPKVHDLPLVKELLKHQAPLKNLALEKLTQLRELATFTALGDAQKKIIKQWKNSSSKAKTRAEEVTEQWSQTLGQSVDQLLGKGKKVGNSKIVKSAPKKKVVAKTVPSISAMAKKKK